MSQSEFPINLEMNSGWSMITEIEKINRLVLMSSENYTVHVYMSWFNFSGALIFFKLHVV